MFHCCTCDGAFWLKQLHTSKATSGKRGKWGWLKIRYPQPSALSTCPFQKKGMCWGYMGRPWNPPFSDISIGFPKRTPKSSKSWMTRTLCIEATMVILESPTSEIPKSSSKIPAKITMQSLANHHFMPMKSPFCAPSSDTSWSMAWGPEVGADGAHHFLNCCFAGLRVEHDGSEDTFSSVLRDHRRPCK